MAAKSKVVNGMRRYCKEEKGSIKLTQVRETEKHVYGNICVSVSKIKEEQHPIGVDKCENRMQRYVCKNK